MWPKIANFGCQKLKNEKMCTKMPNFGYPKFTNEKLYKY